MLRAIDKLLSKNSQGYRAWRGALQGPVLLNTIPKAGTHLVSQMLFSIPHTVMAADMTDADKFSNDRDRLAYIQERGGDWEAGKLYIGHIPYSPEIADYFAKNNVKQVFIYREPRDVSVSMYHYVMREKGNHYHKPLFKQFPDDAARLLAVIEGHGAGKSQYEVNAESVPNLWEYYQAYLPWLQADLTLPLKFEDLISEEKKQQQVGELLSFLGLNASSENIQKLIQLGQNPQRSSTFRKGKAGSWKEEYQEIHLEAFQKVGGPKLLELMNYEL